MRLISVKNGWHWLVDGRRTRLGFGNRELLGKVHLFPTGGGWYLSGLAVLPRHRGKKHGHEIMRRVLQLARKRGKNSIFLWVAADNTAAIRVYEAAGFRCRIDEGGWRFYLWIG